MSVAWSSVSARLDGARIYWLAVVDRRGAPRTFPHWGVVVSDVLYFYLAGTTGAALDIGRNPRIALNLEDGENAVLVRGKADPVGLPTELPEIVAAFAEKYDNLNDSRFPNPNPELADYIYRLTPTWALFFEEVELSPVSRRLRSERDPRVRVWNAG
jgi:pyridoxamine 5'-phosphate oxidase-like protein